MLEFDGAALMPAEAAYSDLIPATSLGGDGSVAVFPSGSAETRCFRNRVARATNGSLS
jgi:hypothetical protein